MQVMIEYIKEYFSNKGDKFCKHMQDYATAIMQCGKANTYSMARQLSKTNGKTFKTNEMALYRFLQNEEFQIDDGFWRNHIALLFQFMQKNKIIKTGDKIQINVDFTTHEDNFLILSASVLLKDKAITIYFTTRKYPVKKEQMSQKKMEGAFIRGLKHVLSKKYKYVIVADRGFGNQRFANLCNENGFEYVLRIKENLLIQIDQEKLNLKDLVQPQKFDGHVLSWKENHHFTILQKDKKVWYLLSNNRENDAGSYYEKRFKIEKNYQDYKSSGYDIEKNKIRKYDRFKRMLYLVVLAHGLTSVIGHIISSTRNNIKKNFIETDQLNTKIILAFLESDMRPYLYIIKNPCVL